MDQPIFTALLLIAGFGLAIAAQRRSWQPSLRVTLATGLAFRVVLLVLAATSAWQPVDFLEGFKPAGEAVLHGQDPVLSTDGSWHFLPMVPYFYALGLSVGLPWVVAGRLCTFIADMVLIVLVGKLAGPARGRMRRFQYACNPIALMVSIIHAQVEPVALAFLVGAYVVAMPARDRAGDGRAAIIRAVSVGALFGLSLSAKSWPIVLLPVVLSMLPTWRLRLYGLIAAGAVPLAFLATLPLFVKSSWQSIINVAQYVGGVRPIVGEWGWTALLTGGNWDLVPAYSRIGQIVLYASLGVVAWMWRRGNRLDMTTAMLLAFMIVTPRMGAQYLLWFTPFLVARPTRWSQWAIGVSAVWAGIGYLALTQLGETDWWIAHSWWARASILVIPFLALAMPWDRRQSSSEPKPPPEAPSTPEPAMTAG
ncbi:hypothetical protein J4573_08040 [Actinomadura barringtoniae]|uniref:DUF2029 domain-containing protein n=1 Tax=Actinomadura barringtoniae TaxID=1427535 RepID=A0A939T189_9ACTN|nr:hypothetical protein [Actinomadura barringtoniae]MBO2447036.1 hypothetical protein [Actinomadura barringtoniae]